MRSCLRQRPLPQDGGGARPQGRRWPTFGWAVLCGCLWVGLAASPQPSSAQETPSAGQSGVTAIGDLPPDVRPVYLSRVEIDGDVVGNLAELRIEIDVNLTVDGWQAADLALAEAGIVRSDHSSEATDATAAPVLDADRGTGLRWRFRGRGRHTLTLDTLVPVSAAPGGGQRLALSLPTLPNDLYEATLRLRVEADPVEVRAPDAIAIQTRRVRKPSGRDEPSAGVDSAIDAVRTEIRASVQQTRLQVDWSEPLAVETRRIATAETDFTVRFAADGRSLDLTAAQTLTATNPAALEQFTVELPRAFELVAVAAADRRMIETERLERSAGESAGRLRIRVAEPPDGPLRLVWQFRRLLDLSAEQTLEVDGLAVPNAARQNGTVLFEPSESFQLRFDRSSIEAARLLEAISPLRTEATSRRTFGIEAQPFRLPMTLVPQRPYLSTAQTARLHVDRDRITLVSRIAGRIETGRATEIAIRWNPVAGDGWSPLAVFSPERLSRTERLRLTPGDPTGGSIGPLAVLRGSLDPQGTGWLFRPEEPLSGSFELLLTASRPLMSNETAAIPLPLVVAEQVRPPTIEVGGDDAVEVELSGVGESHLRELSPEASPVAADDTPALPSVRSYEASGESPEIEASVTWHPRDVTVTASAAVRLVQPNGEAVPMLESTQTLDYIVRYGREETVRLQVPAETLSRRSLDQVVRAVPIAIDSVPVDPAAVVAVTPDQLAIPLPEGRSRFAVTIGPFWTPARSGPPGGRAPTTLEGPDPTESVSDSTTVPLFSPATAPLREIVCRLDQTGRGDLTLLDAEETISEGVATDGWVRLPLDGDPTYSAPGGAAIRVRIGTAAKAPRPPLVIGAGLVAIDFTADGDALVTTRLRIAAADFASVDGELAFSLPSDAREVVVAVDDETRQASSEEVAGAAPRRLYTATLSRAGEAPAAAGDREVRIAYRLPRRYGGSGRTAAELPELMVDAFARRVDVAIALPPDDRLLVSPASLTPLFAWTRSRLAWERIAPDPVQREWAERWTEPEPGAYLFRSTGYPGSVRLVAIDRSLLVLLGAAVTLAFAFLLMKAPPRHQLPLVLVAAFSVALAGVRFQEPLQVMAQPALLGLTLAIVAVSVDRWNRSERVAPVLTVPSESEFLPASETGPLESVATVVQPGVTLVTAPASRSDVQV